MRGRTVLLTGGTSGIGRATAEALVKRGAHLIIGARDLARGKALSADLRQLGDSTGGGVTVLSLDLADSDSAAKFSVAAQRVANERGDGIHTVVCSAAEIRCAQAFSRHGVDVTFATNHLGPHQLLEDLVPVLRTTGSKARRARVVLLGSRLERQGLLDLVLLRDRGLPDPRILQAPFNPMQNYATSKLANMHLATALSRRLQGASVDVLVLSPGMVHTGLWSQFPSWYRALTYPVRALFLRSSADAAEGVVFAVAAKEAEGLVHAYLYDGRPLEASPAAQDSAVAEELFNLCSDIVAGRVVVGH